MFCTHHLHGRSPEVIPEEVRYRSPGSQVFVFYNGWHVVKHKTTSQSLIVANRHRHHKNRGVHSVVFHFQAYHSSTAASQISQWNLSYMIKRPHNVGLISTEKKEIKQKCIILIINFKTLTIIEILIWDSLTWFQYRKYFHLHEMPCNNNKLQFCIH